MVNHLGLKSNFIGVQLSSTVEFKDSYFVVRTPSRPDFFWGNYLIFNSLPSKETTEEWIKIYKEEFDLTKQRFMTMTWDSSEKGDLSALYDYGFKLETQQVLLLDNLIKPEKINSKVEVRVLKTESEWNQLKRTQWIHNWPLKEEQMPFLINKIKNFRELQDQGCGLRFGAFIENKLVGDLGIYFKDSVARFSSVCTDKEFYNQGVCRTLVYNSIIQFKKEFKVEHFIMQATDTEYAKNIYKKLGFSLWGYSHDLTWLR
jgi:hypothetical protein